MNRADVLAHLRREIARVGTAKEWAEKHGISAPYVSDILRGNREPANKVLTALGLEKIVTYRRARQP